VLIADISPATDENLARALLSVQHAAYAVEAALIRDDRIPPLHEDLDGLRDAQLQWIGAFIAGELVGAVAWAEQVDELDIDRLVVDPRAHRRGIGLALVHELLTRAGNRRTSVATGRDNAPADALYKRLGFLRVDDQEVLPGLWVARYTHLP
jgi:ribosomal protein S18 acetylase RimI-like enzyme